MKDKLTFQMTPMVRVDYSFPNVDQKTRSRIYDVIFDNTRDQFRGGWGDGGNNTGGMYIPAHEVEKLRRLIEAGLTEIL